MPDSTPPPDSGIARSAPARATEAVEHFFRHETGRLHGALMRRFGPENLSLIEDVTQEALLRAMRVWSVGGVPANPAAWITRAAINLALDALRHRQMANSKEPDLVVHFENQPDAPTLDSASGNAGEIRDDSLRLMFVCCHPALAADAQVVLALKVLCGFGSGEIARAFLSSEAAIEKQLTRTKQRIRDAGIRFEIPEGPALDARLDGVLATLYLLFNEGHKASSGDRLLREELCGEAMRLADILVTHPAGATPQSHALLALMLLTASRFPARLDAHGALIRLEDQDRKKWDETLIARGLFHLEEAAQGDALSEYHLQAGIAALHATAPDHAETDWPSILDHYDTLCRMTTSPVVALNRAVAVAHVHGPHAGLLAIAAIPGRDRLESHYLFHAISGEFHRRLGNSAAALESFRLAMNLAEVGPERTHLARMAEGAGNALSGNSMGPSSIEKARTH